MKKIKFMLLSLALVAVVGGALAFKVKTSKHFCTTIARDPGEGAALTCKDASDVTLTCPNYTSNVTTVNGNSATFYCTTPDNGSGNCNNNPNCELTVRQTIVPVTD